MDKPVILIDEDGNVIEQSDAAKDRIDALALVDRLQRFAMGEHGIHMDREQINAACRLLAFVIPQAQAPRELNIKGQIDLVSLIDQALNRSTTRDVRKLQ